MPRQKRERPNSGGVEELRKVYIGARLTSAEGRELRRLARARRLTRSTLIREAVLELLRKTPSAA
jgi:hypothetical protein